jgi:hypothetical protein
VGPVSRPPERNCIVTDPIKPSRRDRLRPLELLVMSAVVGVFIGLVVAGSVRNIALGGIFAGVGFIVALVVLATLAITTKPDDTEQLDIDNQDRGGH